VPRSVGAEGDFWHFCNGNRSRTPMIAFDWQGTASY